MLRERLSGPGALVAPGVFDPLSALLVEQAGFRAAYLSGASLSYTRLGRPDLGLVGAAEVADTVARITGRVELPLIVDADTGFGNALNVVHTVRALEGAGTAAVQIEDQSLPKRCGHLRGKALVTTEEMAGKVAAACDARRSDETLIVARTDAIAVEGLGRALERAEAYLEAGADVLFVEAPRDTGQMRAITAAFPGTPLLANMVEGGRTPVSSADDLAEIGFRLVITPGSLVRAMAFAGAALLEELARTGATAGYKDRMLDFGELNERLGLDEALALGDAYAAPD